VTYKTILHDTMIEGIMPNQGWVWPEHDVMFNYFATEIVKYKRGYQDHCRDFKVAIQAGGHCGVFPRIMSSVFETVYTFEPDGYSFHCLVNNCQLDNIKKFNAALGAKHEMVYQKYRGQHNVGVNNYSRPIEGQVPIMEVRDVTHIDEIALVNIPQIRIDDLGLQNCNLIHLDVEGYEGFIVEGAKETIREFKPVIIVETLTPEAEDFIKSIGYCSLHHTDMNDVVFICK